MVNGWLVLKYSLDWRILQKRDSNTIEIVEIEENICNINIRHRKSENRTKMWPCCLDLVSHRRSVHLLSREMENLFWWDWAWISKCSLGYEYRLPMWNLYYEKNCRLWDCQSGQKLGWISHQLYYLLVFIKEWFDKVWPDSEHIASPDRYWLWSRCWREPFYKVRMIRKDLGFDKFFLWIPNSAIDSY